MLESISELEFRLATAQLPGPKCGAHPCIGGS
jgi:hypothetical protein